MSQPVQMTVRRLHERMQAADSRTTFYVPVADGRRARVLETRMYDDRGATRVQVTTDIWALHPLADGVITVEMTLARRAPLG